MTIRISTAIARKDFASVLRASARGERIKLTRYDKTIAIVIPKQDLISLEDCEKVLTKAERPSHPRRGNRAKPTRGDW